MTRAEKVARAQQLRAEGMSLREVAAEMGAAVTTVHTWLSDPDGSKQRARRESYGGTCEDCGAHTTGSRPGGASRYCRPCADRRAGEAKRVWTREALIACIREWAEIHGEPPAMPDWNAYEARKRGYDARAARFERERWPGVTRVVRMFGSWNAGIAAAGFEPRAPHGGDGNQRHRRAGS